VNWYAEDVEVVVAVVGHHIEEEKEEEEAGAGAGVSF
jgi:hypothetical protein